VRLQFPSGVYLLRLKIDNKNIVAKIVITK